MVPSLETRWCVTSLKWLLHLRSITELRLKHNTIGTKTAKSCSETLSVGPFSNVQSNLRDTNNSGRVRTPLRIEQHEGCHTLVHITLNRIRASTNPWILGSPVQSCSNNRLEKHTSHWLALRNNLDARSTWFHPQAIASELWQCLRVDCVRCKCGAPTFFVSALLKNNRKHLELFLLFMTFHDLWYLWSFLLLLFLFSVQAHNPPHLCLLRLAFGNPKGSQADYLKTHGPGRPKPSQTTNSMSHILWMLPLYVCIYIYIFTYDM